MIKTVCDICGSDMETCPTFLKDKIDMAFRISSNGRIWDICNECREDLAVWIADRKARPICHGCGAEMVEPQESEE